MIISHTNKFIFFAVPKTATHAIRQALHVYTGPDDWEQQTLFGEQALPIAEIARLQHGHITVREIKPFLSAETWKSYYKFSIVRNPFDRFVSVCSFFNRNDREFADNPLLWMKTALRRPRFQQRLLVRAQYLQLIDDNGELALDYLGRYEQLQASVDHIFDTLGLDSVTLQAKNSSEHDDFTDYYDPELRAMVAEFYHQDFSLFNY